MIKLDKRFFNSDKFDLSSLTTRTSPFFLFFSINHFLGLFFPFFPALPIERFRRKSLFRLINLRLSEIRSPFSNLLFSNFLVVLKISRGKLLSLKFILNRVLFVSNKSIIASPLFRVNPHWRRLNDFNQKSSLSVTLNVRRPSSPNFPFLFNIKVCKLWKQSFHFEQSLQTFSDCFSKKNCLFAQLL